MCLPFELYVLLYAVCVCVCLHEGFAAAALVSVQMNGHNKAVGSNEQVHLCL